MSQLGSHAMRILVVDDEPAILRFLRVGLASHGYDIAEARTAAEALTAVKRKAADLVVLDLGLPDRDGIGLIPALKAADVTVLIIVLSSRGDEQAKVAALDGGADDYVTKPFGMEELLARIRAATRHRLAEKGELPVFRSGGLAVDLVRRIATVSGDEVKLSPTEWRLLRLLIAHAGNVLTHRFLLREVWGAETDVQYLRIYMRALRQKIEVDPERPRLLLTETGVGYRLRAADEAAATGPR